MSAITPSARGLIAVILLGVFQSIRFASAPTATTLFVPFSTAMTEGSSITIPCPLTYISVLHVPKSIPISVENLSKNIFPPPHFYLYSDIFFKASG